MPLSEEELRLLEQMERALVQDDPRLAHTLRGTAHRQSARRRAFVSAAVFLLGIAALMGGAVSQVTALGILGFVVMLGSATIGIAAWRDQALDSGDTAARPAAGGPAGEAGGLLERFTRRLRRRDDS